MLCITAKSHAAMTALGLESSVGAGPLAAQERARHRADRERIRERLDIRPHVPLLVQHNPGIARQAERVHELEGGAGA